MVDRIIFVCTVLLAAVYLWGTSKIPTLALGDPLGPKAFPQMLGIGLLIGAGMLLAEIIRAGRNRAPGEKAEPLGLGKHHAVVIGVVAGTALYIFLFERLGYMLCTAIYLLVLTNIFNRGRWLMNTLTSLLFAVFSYLAFTKLLDVNLARGILPF